MLEHVPFIHDVRLARTLVFQAEKRVGSCIFEQKMFCEHVEHRKSSRARTVGFRVRKALPTLHFLYEMCCRPRNFCPKPIGATPFYVQNRGVRCHQLIAN